MSSSNVYIFTNSYLPILGGIQTVTGQIAEGLNNSLAIRIITNKYPKNLKSKEIINGVFVNRYRLGNSYAPLNSIKGIITRLNSYVFFTVNLLRFLILFTKDSPKVINIHFPLHQIKYVLFLKRFFNFRIITSFHGHDVLRWLETSKKSNLFKDQLKLISISDEVTACSNYLSREVESVYNLAPKSVKTIYNGTDLVNRRKKQNFNNYPYVFAFGRLEYHKGFDILIKAFSKIDHNNLQLVIAGTGSHESDLKSLAKNLKLKDNIKFIGRISKSEIDSYTKNALCIVIPSRREPFGIAVLEAIASGRPVLATNVGGIPELLNKKFGLMVMPNLEEMTSGLEQLLNRFESPSVNIIDNYIKKFSVEIMVNNYKKYLDFEC